jgi:hypothetical protein
MVMNRDDPAWATITSYENLPGCPQPMAATRAWLRERGIDWMPLSDNEIRCNLACGQVLMVDGMAGPRGGTRPVHRDGILTRAAVLKQAPDLSAVAGR